MKATRYFPTASQEITAHLLRERPQKPPQIDEAWGRFFAAIKAYGLDSQKVQSINSLHSSRRR
jgi:hypothetical protein